ncbi:MAG TPA: NAD(P)-dependent alcohol dehydrogenase [Pyrinomonadaceae bacterium]|nr:NAD(P)-dependent alcohol dehydrogenase [Pyrinomonadaceae bacterium]
MLQTRGYAATGPEAPLGPFDFARRDVGPRDVLIEILYCGICHSDIHQARNEWDNSTYPMVPGHEIVGRVAHAGAEVTRFKEGDTVGVGCFVDSCRECASCREGEEQFCDAGSVQTYNSTERDGQTPTYGGYSTQIVVDENYVLRVRDGQPLAGVAPLLCAGITTYSPLRRYKVGPGQRVGVVGLGGLGHMAVKLAASMGAKVTVFSTSPSKEEDARSLGAHDFVVTKDPQALEALAGSFDFVIDTVSAPHDPNLYLDLLRRDGAMVLVGVPEKPLEVSAFSLIMRRRTLAGSLIGGIRETQEMLDYCAEHGITADVEVIGADQINEAYGRTVKGDVKYRFVIDAKTL